MGLKREAVYRKAKKAEIPRKDLCTGPIEVLE